MIIEVGKIYVNRAGDLCKVVSSTYTDGRLCVSIGMDTYYSYFLLENGRENREVSFLADRNGSHLGECCGKDLISEYKMPNYEWAWCKPDKNGIWAYGGDRQKASPELSGFDIVEDYSTRERLDCWRCYLGPIPQVAQPKKLVKQTLWMVKYYSKGMWEELWLPTEETPKFTSFHDIGHQTTTTRHI